MAKKTISESKRKQLEAAGYIISKTGQTVRNKDGGTVAGINENGNLFGSANSKAFKILKGEYKPEAKPNDKPKDKPKASSSAPESTSTRPQARRTDIKPLSNPPAVEERNLSSVRGGRGDGIAEMARRALDKPNTTGQDSNINASYGSLANAANRMESFRVSRQDKTINGFSFAEWKKLTRAQRVENNLPLTNQEFMRAMRLKGADVPAVSGENGSLSTGSSGRTQTTSGNYTQEDLDRRLGGRRTGMSKGGMVKSGNKDYKKSGMFYKSASPRGYK